MSDGIFAVYGGGRWRQLCLKSGRVCGWGAVRVACQRRGRLELVPSAPALRALRALAQGRHSAARAGPPVPHQRNERHYVPDTSKHWVEEHTCCQPHMKHCRTAVKCNSTPKAKPQVHAAVQADRHSAPNRRASPRTPRDTLRNHSPPPERTDNDVETTIDNIHRNKKRKRGAETKVLLRRKIPNGKLWEAVGADDAAQVVSQRKPDALRGSEHESEATGDSALLKKRKQARKTLSTGSDGSIVLTSQSQDDQDAPCKELLISEDAVALLRGFLRRDTRNVFGVQPSQFDEDDACKERLFYRLNPLVALRRCPRVAALLRRGRDAASLRDFASSLGLRRVAGAPGRRSPSPRSPRHAQTQGKALDTGATPANGLDGPPTRRSLRSRTSGNDSSVASMSGRLPPNASSRSSNRRLTNASKTPPPKPSSISSTNALDRPPTNASKRPPSKMSTSESTKASNRPLNNALDRSLTNTLKRPLLKSSSRSPTKTSNRPATNFLEQQDEPGSEGRNYAASEDEHVLRFVCGAARARRVNGNRVWRALPPLHLRATGRARSWQSLRNRYLRYLLPALSTLLPPSEAARLRAAAAKGELKAGKPPPRRNSAFAQPRTRSAWGARARPRPGPASPPPSDAEAACEATPTYAQVTQRFARRATRSDTSSLAAGAASPARGDLPPRTSLRRDAERSPPRKRTRRLYNPGAM